MSRFGSRTLAAVGAGAFAVVLAVGGGVPAGAAPESGQIDSMSDLKGGWLTPLVGFQGGDSVSWQHRLIVRKVKGQAAVAWEEWRDCAGHAVACRTGKASDGGLARLEHRRQLLVSCAHDAALLDLLADNSALARSVAWRSVSWRCASWRSASSARRRSSIARRRRSKSARRSSS